jgi:hypothetical protein
VSHGRMGCCMVGLCGVGGGQINWGFSGGGGWVGRKEGGGG